jgi:lysophospholipase L1-like esterase
MDTEFEVPWLNNPGCPPPLKNIFTQERLSAIPCAYREDPIPTRINQLGIPGAEVLELINYFDPGLIPSETDVFKTLLLGARTPIEIAQDLRPTFISLAIGSNDILGALLDAANPGDPARITDPAVFTARYTAVLDSLEAIGSVEGGVLIGLQPIILDAATGTTSIPYFTAGAAWLAFEAFFDTQTPLNVFDVDAACATAFVPFAFGAPVLGAANAKIDSLLGGTLVPPVVPATIVCTDNTSITAAETANALAARAQYNAAIEQLAADRGYAYVDLTDTFASVAATAGAFRPFPAFDPADPQHESQPFGGAVSIDGIHWSASLHEAVAAAVVAAINAEYDTDL